MRIVTSNVVLGSQIQNETTNVDSVSGCDLSKKLNPISISLWFHEARRTRARTWWTVKPKAGSDIELTIEQAIEQGFIKRIWSSKRERKTHWREGFLVFDTGIVFVCHRITNQGKYRKFWMTPNFFSLRIEK